MKTIILNAKGLAIALIGAVLANYLHIPLPWLLGPLLAALFMGSIGKPLSCHPHWRKGGQIIIGMALGLYFTPALVQAISAYWGFILLGILWSLVLGTMLAVLQYRINALDWATAWFSSAIGSASEMVNIAEQYNAQVDKVVAAHSLRIVILVVLIPIFMGLYFQVEWSDLIVLDTERYGLVQVLLLFLLAVFAGIIFQYFNLLNAWILGPLTIIGLFSFFGILQFRFPEWFIALGQLFIGWSLGSKFPFSFLKNSKKFIGLTVLFNLLALVLSIIFALLLIRFSHADAQILILGLSPGGIAEMSLMAKALGLAVPIVVAFQLSRLIFVILTTRYFYRLSRRLFF
ncbi:AbrB family transcriptional regulator [Acinetobacter sp. ASP199]|uniref:AbrB family transcriptional regulator n=1 Tax=unclassified Acinetobacter TaxID=196816 RepID=UPI001F6170D7|nr:AbrB family transcriptional regulator [Acinetobacter sp. ASP199]UNT58352.1 AbrB family transcriptional regulator [Acinetobacter sp. ASP199]